MNIKIAGEVFKWNENNIDDLMELIENKLSDSNLYFSHLVIDGKPIYENFEIYIQDNFNNIQVITVIGRTLKEFVSDILGSTYEYIQGAIPQLEMVCNKLYTNTDDEVLNDLSDFLGALGWIFESTNTIDSLEGIHDDIEEYKLWNRYISKIMNLKELLPQLLDAMENRDNILLSDLIRYEVIDVLNDISNAIVSMIGVEFDVLH